MQKVQIKGELFIYLVEYFINEKKEFEEQIKEELQDKIDRLANHFDYTEQVRKRKERESLY